MSVIDFELHRKKKAEKEAEQAEVKEKLSPSMQALMAEIFKQSVTEVSQVILNEIAVAAVDSKFYIPDEDRLGIYKTLKDTLEDTALAMDYIIETIEGDDDEK